MSRTVNANIWYGLKMAALLVFPIFVFGILAQCAAEVLV